MCSEMFHELFHPKRSSVSAVMPLTKVDDDTERKRQAARQALLSDEDAARSGLLGPKPGMKTESVRSVRQAANLPQMRRVKL